jgi:hypothetical protein
MVIEKESWNYKELTQKTVKHESDSSFKMQ